MKSCSVISLCWVPTGDTVQLKNSHISLGLNQFLMPLHRVLEELASTDKLDLKVQVGHLPKWANLNIRIFHLVICCMVKTPKVESNIIKEKNFEKISCLLLFI